jgi:di/tricarboxylate transporter
MASTAKISPSKVLMPLAFGSLLGAAHSVRHTSQSGGEQRTCRPRAARAFGFFSFTPVGLMTLVVGVGRMSSVGPPPAAGVIRGRRVTAYADPEGLALGG